MKQSSRNITDLFLKKADLILVPRPASHFTDYSGKLARFNSNWKLITTEWIGFFEIGKVLSRTYTESIVGFQFLNAFPINVWIIILVLLFIISIVSFVMNKKFSFCNYFCNYFELLINKSIQKPLIKLKSKLILGIWLIACLYLSIGFTTFILDHMIRAAPVVKVDSLLDLSQRHDLRVYAREDSPFAAFIRYGDTDVTKAISKRLHTYNNFLEVIEEMVTALSNGSIALINGRINLLFTLISISKTKIYKKLNKRFWDSMHFSKGSLGFESFYLFVNNQINGKILLKLNRLYVFPNPI